MSVIIKIEKEDFLKSLSWAKYLQGVLQAGGMKNDVKGCGDTIKQLHAGKLGEVAVCRYLGEQPDYSEGSDGGKDLIFNGETIDVKCTPRANAKYLVWPKTKPLSIAADVLVGARQTEANDDSASIEIFGFVRKSHPEKPFGDFFTYAFGNEGLVKGTPFGLLKKLTPIENLFSEALQKEVDKVVKLV